MAVARENERNRAIIPDAVAAARSYLKTSERQVATDTVRDVRNLAQSTRLLLLVELVSVLMGIAAWAFLLSLDVVTDFR